MTDAPPGLETVGMTKRFGAFTALDHVELRVQPGTVHALLGENGAGKSTLVKCIMGYYHADEGQIMVGNREVLVRNPREAHALGLGMVYQHFTLIPNMTVAENLILARGEVPAVIDRAAERRRIATFMDRMPFRLDPDAPINGLAAGEKQRLEILKQLYLDRRILILDEPTSVLTPGEADQVLGLLRDMAHAGRITLVMITHKFREVTKFADEVTVLRRGRRVGGGKLAETTPTELARLMVGAAELPRAPERAAGAAGQTRLEIDRLAADDDTGNPAVRGVSLAVRAGEILGIAGVSGNGQRELVEVLAGQREAGGGTVRVHGDIYAGTRAEIARHRIACLPEEPLKNASVGAMSVADNLALRVFDRPPFARHGFLRRGAFERHAREAIARYGVKTSSPAAPLETLSGGNVQRAVLARELADDVEVLIAANPCFGLDLAAVAETRARIVAARNRGAAVLLVSEDLDELMELSDRIAVMFNGALTEPVAAHAADVTLIGSQMAGH